MAVSIKPTPDALLIGYENQENLGLRSIMAYLRSQGYWAELVAFCPGHQAEILAMVQDMQPRLVGFSIIFQYTLNEFGDLMNFLRENGITAHFTAGGHFPTLRTTEVMEALPALDTVVRFEGELTLAELLNHLDQPDDWADIQGLAFRRDTEIILNTPRPLIPNLDSLPSVYRGKPKQTVSGINTAAMLASRGCLFNCTFCSIRQFYGGTTGPLRRVRSPQAVVDEMAQLYRASDVRYFAFQDDDFAARTPKQREWLEAFLHALDHAGLADQIRWKISCRVDDLEPAILEQMIQRGLMAVYLGVESGNALGLQTMNKRVTVGQNLAAIDLLKRYGMAVAMGFMLFDPSTTFETLRENIAFLYTVGEDGYFPVNFCKMLPYAGTPIEAQLQAAGRLTGTMIAPDYNFLDGAIDWYAFVVHRIFAHRNFATDGLVNLLQNADFEQHLSRTLGTLNHPDEAKLGQLIAQANKLATTTLQNLLGAICHRGMDDLLQEKHTLVQLAEDEWRGEAEIEIALRTWQANLQPAMG